MKPTVTHNPAVMQEVSPPNVTLTMSVRAALLIGSLLRHVRTCDLEAHDIPTRTIDLLVPDYSYLTVTDDIGSQLMKPVPRHRPVLRVEA